MNKEIFSFLVFIIIYYFLTSCANQMSPTGGPKDTIPPVLINSIPINQSLNFKRQEIVLEFDERIKTEKIKDQLIITPLTESDYDYTIKKNTLKLSFEEPFKDSTTYTLNFREGIQDLTEGNPTEDNKFTFSTGSYIDSMSIEGYVKTLLTYDTLEEVTVGLFRPEDTVNIFNGSPYYFTEVDEDGKYLIENIKNGKYLLYAFADENKNLELETNKELYAFSKDTIYLDTGLVIRNLDLIGLDLSEFKLMTAIASGKYFEINFNKFLFDYDIKPINNNHTFYTNKSKENKSIRFYNNFNETDSLQISFMAIDSINSIIEDTLYVKFSDSRRKPDELSMTIYPKSNSAIEPRFTVELAFNKPIVEYSLDSLYVQYDTTKISQVSDSTFEWNKFRDKLTFDVMVDKALVDTLELRKKKLAEIQRDSIKTADAQSTEKKQMRRQEATTPKINQGLQLYIGAGTFYSADNDTSKALGAKYKFIDPSNFGTQDITVESDYKSYTIQLLKENFDHVQEFKNETSYSFKYIEPGKYKIRVLIDSNNDGQWSPGNMIEQIEPEPVYIYPETLVIRADWQTSLKLTF